MDRHLEVNTVKHRTHSLFRQGCMLYDLMLDMPEQRLRPLIKRFVELILQHRALTRHTEPTADHKLLLQQLGLTLPPQPPPRIAAELQPTRQIEAAM